MLVFNTVHCEHTKQNCFKNRSLFNQNKQHDLRTIEQTLRNGRIYFYIYHFENNSVDLQYNFCISKNFFFLVKLFHQLSENNENGI